MDLEWLLCGGQVGGGNDIGGETWRRRRDQARSVEEVPPSLNGQWEARSDVLLKQSYRAHRETFNGVLRMGCVEGE